MPMDPVPHALETAVQHDKDRFLAQLEMTENELKSLHPKRGEGLLYLRGGSGTHTVRSMKHIRDIQY